MANRVHRIRRKKEAQFRNSTVHIVRSLNQKDRARTHTQDSDFTVLGSARARSPPNFTVAPYYEARRSRNNVKIYLTTFRRNMRPASAFSHYRSLFDFFIDVVTRVQLTGTK